MRTRVCLVDWAVGPLVTAIAGRGASDNTMVMVTSDNGAPMIFSDDGDVAQHRPNGDWRGQKGDLWDLGAFTSVADPAPLARPLVHHSLGGRCAIRVGRWKAIFGAGPGGGFSEPSISSLFNSGTGKAHTNPPWDAEHPDGQLFDILIDPGETTNMWHDEPAVVTDLYARLPAICGDESSGLPFGVLAASAAVT